MSLGVRYIAVKSDITRPVIAAFLQLNDGLGDLVLTKSGAKKTAKKPELLNQLQLFCAEKELVKNEDKYIPLNFVKVNTGVYFFPLVVGNNPNLASAQ